MYERGRAGGLSAKEGVAGPRKREDQKTTQKRRGEGEGQGTGWVKGLLIGISPKNVLSPISRMSQIDPRMIRGRSEGIRSDDRSQRGKS